MLNFGNCAYLYDLNDTIIDSLESSENSSFLYETKEVVRCINTGLIESPICPHSMTLETCALFDKTLT